MEAVDAAGTAVGMRPTLDDLPAETIEQILAHLCNARDLARANAAARLFRQPVERALRARERACAHARALPSKLPDDVTTWTEELLARERIRELASAHTHVVTNGALRAGHACDVSWVDARGRVHTRDARALHAEAGGGAAAEASAVRQGALRTDWREPTPRVPALSSVRVRALAGGSGHLLALSACGAVYGCGENEYGQLGLGDAMDRRAFARVDAPGGEAVVAVAAACCHSVALTASGGAYSWGWNKRGQLGHGDRAERWEPTRIDALAGVRVGGIAAGVVHTLLLSTDGAVYSCGCGFHGSLGHGDERERRTPRRIEALSAVLAVHVSAGSLHSLAVDAAGGVRAWGYNHVGQLGHGDTESRLVPARIEALAPVRAVRTAACDGSSAVLCADGSARVFGECALSARPVPVAVLQPPGLARAGRRAPWCTYTRVVSCVLHGVHALYASDDGSEYRLGYTGGE